MATYTEDEARKKWCPFARVIDDLSGAASSARLRDGTVKCIASECMAWRWIDVTEQNDNPTVADRTVKSSVRGFCGLAGQP